MLANGNDDTDYCMEAIHILIVYINTTILKITIYFININTKLQLISAQFIHKDILTVECSVMHYCFVDQCRGHHRRDLHQGPSCVEINCCNNQTPVVRQQNVTVTCST